MQPQEQHSRPKTGAESCWKWPNQVCVNREFLMGLMTTLAKVVIDKRNPNHIHKKLVEAERFIA